jgi:hypothetical protein
MNETDVAVVVFLVTSILLIPMSLWYAYKYVHYARAILLHPIILMYLHVLLVYSEIQHLVIFHVSLPYIPFYCLYEFCVGLWNLELRLSVLVQLVEGYLFSFVFFFLSTGCIRLIRRTLLVEYWDGLGVVAQLWLEVLWYVVKDEFVYRMG